MRVHRGMSLHVIKLASRLAIRRRRKASFVYPRSTLRLPIRAAPSHPRCRVLRVARILCVVAHRSARVVHIAVVHLHARVRAPRVRSARCWHAVSHMLINMLFVRVVAHVNRYLHTLITSLRHIVHVNHLINCLVVSY
jgi:hypothetical protein